VPVSNTISTVAFPGIYLVRHLCEPQRRVRCFHNPDHGLCRTGRITRLLAAHLSHVLAGTPARRSVVLDHPFRPGNRAPSNVRAEVAWLDMALLSTLTFSLHWWRVAFAPPAFSSILVKEGGMSAMQSVINSDHIGFYRSNQPPYPHANNW
jgi:hypothetical protein